MTEGEQKAWETLKQQDPKDVCKNALVTYNKADSSYELCSLGMDFAIRPHSQTIEGIGPRAAEACTTLEEFFTLSALCYLASAKDVPPTGRLIRPDNMKGGRIFSHGTHVLPLGRLAAKYGPDPQGFLKQAEALGGRAMGFGDASVQLLPMPRIEVTLVLWLPDEEYPGRADLLFDSTAEVHLPVDVNWSVAMLTLRAMYPALDRG